MNTRKTLPDFKTIFDEAAQLIAINGFSAFQAADVAEALNVTPAMLTPVFDDKYSFCASFGRFIDGAVMAQAGDFGEGSDEPAKDRLFEVLMARFDALQPYKEAVTSIKSSAMRDPQLSAVLAQRLPQSMALMLELAGLKADGVKGCIQAPALAAVWLHVARSWLKDDSEDMAKTMAALDKALKDVDSVAQRFF